MGVAGPVVGEFGDDCKYVCYFEAPNFSGEMGKELELRQHFVVGVFVAEGGAVYLLKGVKDEETASVLGGVDAVFVVESDVPKCLELLLFPRFGLSGDHWVVFVEGGIIFVERIRYPRLVLVGRVRNY